MTRIKLIAKDCNYKEPDEMIRDRIVFGTNSHKAKERLINEGDTLTLDKAIQIAQTYEYSQEQLRTMGTSTIHPSLAEVQTTQTSRWKEADNPTN